MQRFITETLRRVKLSVTFSLKVDGEQFGTHRSVKSLGSLKVVFVERRFAKKKKKRDVECLKYGLFSPDYFISNLYKQEGKIQTDSELL